MSKIRKILSILILPFIVGCIGLIGNYTDAHAAEANAGDSFEIYAGSMVCYTDVGGNPYRPPGFNGGSNCSKSGTSGSAKVVYKGNGNYSIEDEKWGVLSDAARSIRLSISGGKLKVDVASNCESKQAAEVSLNSDISAFKNSVNSSLSGTSWSFFCPLYDGDNSTYYQRSTLEFSTSDVTKAEAVPEIDPGTAGGGTDTGDSATSKPTCMNSGGSGTLGWIVCSIMEWLGNAANGAYRDYVEPSLQVDPKLFEGGDDGVRGGWETFRNIANVVFIILFLVVIFSQLTGVGIDNYGIKKILPKLIVSAILINLSYWICLVFIDLSNILGNSFQALFDGLGSSLGEPQLNISGADSVGAIPTGGIVTVGVLGALVIMVGSVWANPAIVLSLLVAALGVAISIFFLFILLAAREAAIIVLTVLSPLAVVCYMLPNTKSMFDKWVKLFEAMLLVYPICGLLVGGGNYISRLLLSSGFGGDGFFRAFTAMIVGIVPIFFIPSVLKGSFSAMGSLGAKISGIGQKVSGTATGAARGSQAYKNMQERGAMRRTRIAAGLNRKGEETGLSRGVGRVMNFGRGGTRAMAGNRAQYLKDQDALYRAEYLDGVGYEASRTEQLKKAGSDRLAAETALLGEQYANVSDEELKKDWEKAFANNDSNLGALTNVLAGRFGPGAANTIGNTLEKTTLRNADGTVNQKALGAINTLQEVTQQNSTLAGQMASKAPDAHRMISSGGVVGNENGSPVYGNLDEFPADFVTTDTDWASVGSGALRRAMDSGQLSTEQAQRILDSDVSSVQTALDDKKREILRAGIEERKKNAQSSSGNTQSTPSNPTPPARESVNLQNERNSNDDGGMSISHGSNNGNDRPTQG